MVHPLFDREFPKRAPVSSTPVTASVSFEECGAFGWLKNERDQAVMLEIRHTTGDITALAYPLLESAKFNPSTGITLNFSGTTVTITGCNLNIDVNPGVRLFEGLTRHRVVWIQEADSDMRETSSERDVIVEDVEIS